MNSLGTLCRSRWVLAVALGLGLSWAMSESLGWGVGSAIGGGLALVMLNTRRES